MTEQDVTRPGAHDHDYQNVDEEEIPDDRGSLRVALWIISSVLAVLMVAYPVIQVIDWASDDDDADAGASKARAFVAERFATDALARLSVNDAARWAIPSLHDEIEAIVLEIERRPASDRNGVSVFIARVDCDDTVEAEIECFQAWVRQPGAADLARVELVVGIVNGDARVIDIERINVV